MLPREPRYGLLGSSNCIMAYEEEEPCLSLAASSWDTCAMTLENSSSSCWRDTSSALLLWGRAPLLVVPCSPEELCLAAVVGHEETAVVVSDSSKGLSSLVVLFVMLWQSSADSVRSSLHSSVLPKEDFLGGGGLRGSLLFLDWSFLFLGSGGSKG